MCGIVLAKSEHEASRMLNVLAHRGRDDRRIVCVTNDWYVGQNRLAIVGGNAAYQPFVGSGGVVTTFNGEIYNYRELGKALNPIPQQATEIYVVSALVRSYERFDRMLDGYYGIIQVDSRLGLVTLSRDLFGVIPLYFQMEKGALVAAASEVKALGGSVKEVRAGETLRFSMTDGGFVRHHVYDPYLLQLEDMDFAHLEFLFKRAVKRRVLHSEVPVTVSLSGGLDSALVLWAAAQLRLEVDAITVGFAEDSDEVSNARALAALCRVPWKFVPLNDEMVAEDRELIRYHLEDERNNPIKWRGMLRNFYVAKHAKGTVILCGEGADEIGAGYPSHLKFDGLDLEWKALSTVRSMPAINLDRVNKGGMAWTKEFRTPFLDRALALYVLSCKKEKNKGVFRELAKRMGLPNFILEKPKYGEEEKALEATQ